MEQSNEPTVDSMNEVIAVFVGQSKTHPSDRRWHKCWNCLMAAWDTLRKKIEEENEIDYPVEFGRIIDQWKVWCFLSNIEWAHKEVYKAIQWYNQTK